MDEPDIDIWEKTTFLIKLRKYEEALSCFDNFFSTHQKPEGTRLFIAELWIWRGECLRRLGKFDEAIESYKKGLEKLKGNHEVAGYGIKLAKEKNTQPIYR